MGFGFVGLTQKFFAYGSHKLQKDPVFFTKLGFKCFTQFFCQGRAFAGR